MGKCCLHASSFIFDRIIIEVAGNQDRHKNSDEFDFGPNQTARFGVTCPWMAKIIHFRTWISLRPVGQSWSNFMSSITRGGERLHNVLRQIGSKLWCPWQQKAPIDLQMGKWCLHLFSAAFGLILFILACNEDMSKISDEFEFRPDRTTDYGVSCPWASKKIPIYRLIMGKCFLHASSFIFDQIIIKVAGNQDRHKSSVEFNFGPNQTTHFGVTCPWVTKISHFWTWISLKLVGQSWSNFICSIIRVGERLHKVLGQIDFGTLDSGEWSLPFGLLVFSDPVRLILTFTGTTLLNLYNCICASSWDYGTYHKGDQRRLRWACAFVQSRLSLHCSHTCSMEVDEGSDQKSDI